MQEHATLPHQKLLAEEIKSYSAWLEVEIGLDQHSIPLPHAERVELFTKRIAAGLVALENAAPGIRAKLEVIDFRPFAFTARLSEAEIRAIWHLPGLRLLSDRDAPSFPEPVPDENGMLPFIVDVHMHMQAEGSKSVNVEEITLLVHATDKEAAMDDALLQCRSDMSEHIMGADLTIHKRWWTAERALLNTFRDEERRMYGTAVMLNSRRGKRTTSAPWHPDSCVERVTYGGPKQRPETWEWMIS